MDSIREALARILGFLTWEVGYICGFLSCAVFLMLSAGTYAMNGVSPDTSASIGLLFAITAGISAALMALRGGVMAALPYFLAGSGLFFGFGTYVAVKVPASNTFFTVDQQVQVLPQVNTVNALSVFVAISIAGLFCARRSKPMREMPGLRIALNDLYPALGVILLFSLFVHATEWLTFPIILDPDLASLYGVFGLLPIFGIFLGAALWDRTTGLERITIAMLVLMFSFEGVLSFRKVTIFMPFLALGLGFLVGSARRFYGAAAFVFAIFCYFWVIVSLVPQGRAHVIYDPISNTVAQRLHIVIEVVRALPQANAEGNENGALSRFSPTQFSAYFIGSYDDNFPGDSLQNAGVVLIPRLLWPEKPMIQPGRDFESEWRGVEMFSSLAIGFPAEAYWNLGWWGVVLLSAYIGVMLGLFTRKWFLFQRDGWLHIGIFICGPMVVRGALWVETNIVGSYIGGWMKLMLTILAIDLSARLFFAVRARLIKAEQEAHPGLVPDSPLPRA